MDTLYLVLIIMLLVTYIDSKPTKQLSKRAAVSCKDPAKTNFSMNLFRRPIVIKKITCKPGCYSAYGVTTVFNTTSNKIEAFPLVIACLERKCPAAIEKRITNVDSTRKPGILSTVKCKKPEDELFVMLPVFSVKADAVVFEKAVYDCKCPCPDKTG